MEKIGKTHRFVVYRALEIIDGKAKAVKDLSGNEVKSHSLESTIKLCNDQGLIVDMIAKEEQLITIYA
jgi:hypothetical protein